MDLTIYTYGYYEAMFQVLTAVAMIRQSAFYMALIETASLLTVSYYTFKGAYLAGSGGYKPYIIKAVGMILVIQLLLLPKAPMLIKDNIERKTGRVDNIPIAFAVPVGIIENFGHILTLVFEQAFAPIETLGQGGITQSSYYKYGSVFGARLKKELSQSRIRDPEFLENMRNFHKRCIILPAMIGYQFTPQELFASKNMWKLVKDKAGTLTRLDMRIGKTKTTMNCKEAAQTFENYFNDEIVTIVNRNINKVFGRATNSNLDTSRASAEQLNQVFFANIKANYSEAQPAQETLKQHMMINFIKDYAQASVSTYGKTRAKMQNESSSLISSDLAQETLPMSLVLFKCLVTAIFIFVVPAMLMSGGMKVYSTYLKTLVSLQLWPALNSVLNMIMVLYSHLTPESNLLITYSTASTIENKMDSIVTIAANLQLVIPIVSYYMVSSSSNAMANLAGSFASGISAAANLAAGDVTTGNRSFDNISEGNLSRNMKNANKADYNQSYVSGEIRQQLSSGTQKTTHADGSNTYIAPEPQANYSLSTAMQSHVSQGLTNSVAEHDRAERTYSEAQSNTMAKSTFFLASLAERTHAGENLGINEQTREGRDLLELVSLTNKIHESTGFDWNQSARMAMDGDAALNFKWGGNKDGGGGNGGGADGILSKANKFTPRGLVSKLLPNVSGSMSIAAKATGAAESAARQGVGEESSFTKDAAVKRNLEILQNADKGETWSKESSSDQQKAHEVRAAYEEQTRAEESRTKSAQKIKDYQEAVQQSATVGAIFDRSMRHRLIKQLQKQGWGDMAANMVNNGDPIAQKVFEAMTRHEISKVSAQINHGRQELSDDNLDNRLQQAGNESKAKITQNPETLINPKDIPTTADFNTTQQKIDSQKALLRDQYEQKNEEAVHKVLYTESGIKLAAEPLKAEIKQEDEGSFRNSRPGKWMKIGRQEAPKITVATLDAPEERAGSQFKTASGATNSAIPGASVSIERPIPVSNKASSIGTPEMVEVTNSAIPDDSGSSERPISISNSNSATNIHNSPGRSTGNTEQVDRKSTTVNLSNLQKVERKNKE